MLRNTFCHLPGVGEKTERGLWALGITSWEAAVRPKADSHRKIKPSWAAHLEASMTHHAGRDAAYFAEHLSPRQQWRLFADFQDSCAFLDIETTGMAWSDEITTIALY